jgi:hypothetical protein
MLDMNIHALIEYTRWLLAFGSVFVIVNTVAPVPSFIALTPHDTSDQRKC